MLGVRYKFCLWFENICTSNKEAFHCDGTYYFCHEYSQQLIQGVSTVENEVKKKSYKNISQQICRLVSCSFSALQINNISTYEQVCKKRFHFKEDTRVIIRCSSSRNMRQ